MNNKLREVLSALFIIFALIGIVGNLLIGVKDHDAYNIAIATFMAVLFEIHFKFGGKE